MQQNPKAIRTAAAVSFVLFCAAAFPFAGLVIPPDPTQRAQIQLDIRAAVAASDFARVVSESQRLLEFYPNEPAVRAPIYVAMADAAGKVEDRAHAAEYLAAATAIDPDISGRLSHGGSVDILQALAVAMRTASALQQARQTERMFAKSQAPDSSNVVTYPSTAVGSSVYFIPPGGYQPSPAYDPSVYALVATVLPAPVPAPAVAPPPPAETAAPLSIQPPSRTLPQPQSGLQAPVYRAIVPLPPRAPDEQREAVQAGIERTPMYLPREPYQAAQNYRSHVERLVPVAVVVDRSAAGDAAFFTRACGALIGVADNNLTLTGACGDPPLVIPASEITAIATNSAVGRSAGIFHIATRQGLWLQLTLESSTPEANSRLMQTLRQSLGIAQ